MKAPNITHGLRSRINNVYWMPSLSRGRIFWLRPLGSVDNPDLMNKFKENGLNVSVFDSYDEISTLNDYDDVVDLCIIETVRQSTKEVKVLVKCIRAHSRVPLLLLSEQSSLEWVVQMIGAGADAVIPVQTPDDIIVARAKALLRRWTPQHTS